MDKTKIRTITVDTLTGIQNEMYMTAAKKANFDTWMDFGKDIWQFITDLQGLGFEIIIVLGEPGTGKSTGIRNLPHDTNLWFNADNKNPIWTGGKAEYGMKSNPRFPYHIIPKKYSQIIEHIETGLDNFEELRFAILTGHIEDYKTGLDYKKRLKLLGKVATKMQLEARLETVLYSEIQKDESGNKYVLTTQNSGYDTARSPMSVFEPIIENDYNFVINKLIEFYES